MADTIMAFSKYVLVIGGAAMFDSDGVLIRAVLVLGTGIVTVAGAAAAHAAYEFLSHKVRTRNRLAWAFVLFALAVNAFVLSLILLKVEDVHKSQGIHARFYPAKDAFGEMRHVINQAKDGGTIYSINSFEIPFRGLYGTEAEAARAEEIRKHYFHAIEEKMGHVNYHRLIQVRAGETSNIETLTGPTYISHFKKMVALQERADRDTVTSLAVAHSNYSMSFVIVENPGGRSYLIWQVDKRLAEASGYKAAGYMIVSDPEQVIVRHFKVLFNQVAQEKGVRRVRAAELEPNAGPALPTE